jgi:hypothetical protein
MMPGEMEDGRQACLTLYAANLPIHGTALAPLNIHPDRLYTNTEILNPQPQEEAMAIEQGDVTNKAQPTPQDLRTRLSDVSHTARSKTSEFATHTAAKAREVTSDFGHHMKEFGGKVREKSPHETVRNTANKVADKLESAGAYLEQKNLDGMFDDVAGLIRRYPLQSLLAGIALGFLLSQKRRGE